MAKKKEKKPSTIEDFGFEPVFAEGYGRSSVMMQKTDEKMIPSGGDFGFGNFGSNVIDPKKSSGKASGLPTLASMLPQYKLDSIDRTVMTRGPNYSNIPNRPTTISPTSQRLVYSDTLKKSNLSQKQTSTFAKAGGYTMSAQSNFAKLPAMAHLATSKQQSYRGVAVSNAGSAARLANISIAKASATRTHLQGDPAIGLANSINKQLGINYQYGVYTRRRRRGRYAVSFAKYYTGPSTRQSYTRIIHNGRRVTAYRGMSTGQRVSGEAPHGVVNEYYKKIGVVDWVKKETGNFGIEKTNNLSGLKSTYAYYDKIMGVASKKKTEYEKYSEPLGTRSIISPENKAKAAKKVEADAALAAANAGIKTSKNSGQAVIKARQAAYARANALQKEYEAMPTTGNTGGPVPLYGYIQLSDENLSDVKEYHGELVTASKGLDEGISLLQQGLIKQDVLSGEKKSITYRLDNKQKLADISARRTKLQKVVQAEAPQAEKDRATLDIQNLDRTELFVRGKSQSLSIGSKGGENVVVATRGQGGFVDIKDRGLVDSLGIKFNERKSVATERLIGGLETSLDVKDKRYNELMSQLGEKRKVQVARLTQAKIQNLVKLEKDHLITRSDRVKQVRALEKDRAASLKQVEDKEYFPDVEKFDIKTDLEQLEEDHTATREVLKRGRQAKALSNVTKARLPRTSVVGKRSFVVKRPRTLQRNIYRGSSRVPSLPF